MALRCALVSAGLLTIVVAGALSLVPGGVPASSAALSPSKSAPKQPKPTPGPKPAPGRPGPPLPTPPRAARLAFGVSDWGLLGPTDFRSLSRNRIRVYRRSLDWSEIERSPGRFNFASTDAWVAAAARRGIRIQPILFSSPGWIASQRVYPPKGRSELSLFARYVAAVVARYGRDGSFWRENRQVRYLPMNNWQVWNEANLAFFWGGPPDAGEYLELARAALAAARSQDPRATLMTASLTQDSTRWLGRLLRIPGARRVFDAVALNLYHRLLRSPGDSLRSALRFRRFINRRGMRRKPLHITEFGWRSSSSRRSRKKQASRISKTVRLLRKRRGSLRLKSLSYFSYRDARYGGGYLPSYRTGLRTLGNRAKPAWRTYTRLSRRWSR